MPVSTAARLRRSRSEGLHLGRIAEHATLAAVRPSAHRHVYDQPYLARINPRDGLDEGLVETERGFELVDERVPGERHHVKNATFVRSIEEAAYLIEQGYWIRMADPEKRPSLISPASLRIIRL